jgi:hypothetical protein
MYPMGQQRERGAFEPLSTLVIEVDLLEELLGKDDSTTSLAQLLVGTFDGRGELLKTFIEDPMRWPMNSFVIRRSMLSPI